MPVICWLYSFCFFKNSFQSCNTSRKCKLLQALLVWLAIIWHAAFSLCVCKLVRQLSDSGSRPVINSSVSHQKQHFLLVFLLTCPEISWALDNCTTISIRPPVNFYTMAIIFTHPASNRCKSCLYSKVLELCQPHLAIVDASEVINSTNFNMCL